MEIIGIHSQGFAPSSKGGAYFYLDVDFDPERFPYIDQNKDEQEFVVSIVYPPGESINSKPSYSICSKIKLTDGAYTVSNQGEQLVQDDIEYVLGYATEYNLRRIAEQMESEFQEYHLKYNECLTEMAHHYKNEPTTNQQDLHWHERKQHLDTRLIHIKAQLNEVIGTP